MKRQALLFAILALVSGYVFADAYDFAPGFLTLREKEAVAAPYPELTAPAKDSKNTAENAKETGQSSEAPVPPATEVQKILDAFAADSKRVTGKVSALVVDALSGEVLGEIEADTPRTPASNMKVPTALAALEVLGGEKTFPTRTALDGSTLYLIGGGDVLLGQGEANKNSAYAHASIPELAGLTAKALKDQNVTSVQLLIDSTLFTGPLYHEGVLAENQQYVMQARPLGTKETAQTELFSGEPDIRVAELLSAQLRDQGISVESVARAEVPAPESAVELARVESASVRQLVDHMLTNSDNSTAEALAHLIAVEKGEAGNFAGGAQASSQAISNLGISTANTTFADGSGLSQDNRLTARFLVDIADYVRIAHGGKYGAVASGLPVGGYNGTLEKRFMNDGMGGLVHAKTGSLSDVRSLSGYLQTKQGRLLEFAVLIDEIPEKRPNPETGEEEYTPDPKLALDEALTAIANL